MRRITLAHVVLSMEIGGMETVIANIARNINPDVYRPVIICINKIGTIGYELMDEGIKVIRLPAMLRKVSFLYPNSLIGTLRDEGADIVHTHSGCWHKAAIAGKLSGAKGIIYTEHGRLVPDSRRVIVLDKVTSLMTDYIVPVSQDLKRYLKEIIGINYCKIFQIDNGIDTNHFKPLPKSKTLMSELDISDDCFVIGNIARLAAVKDHKTLIQAFNIAFKAFQNMKLIVVGDGPERSNLEELIKELNLAGNVKLLGFRKDIRELLSIFDLFALSSISEGTSITILEAMASGKPVIATGVGANADLVIEGETGLLVRPGMVHDFAEKIILAYRKKNLIREMGIKGARFIKENFSAEKMTKKYERLYSRLMEDSHSA